MDADRAAAVMEQATDVVEDYEEMGDDGLPPPAYRPAVPEFQPRAEASPEPQSAGFIAPKAPAPGTPSPEALSRLQAAAARAQAAPAAAPQAAAAASQAPGVTQEDNAEQRRFGLNSLIHRMTGAQGEAAAVKQQPARQQPPVQQPAAAAPQAQPQRTAEQERIEIPAFLRRQAN